MTQELPNPSLYAHELILNGGGVWLGVPEKGICEQAYVEGETSKEVKEFYSAEQMKDQYTKGYEDAAKQTPLTPKQRLEAINGAVLWDCSPEEAYLAGIRYAEKFYGITKDPSLDSGLKVR
jgi:hypothetical protein